MAERQMQLRDLAGLTVMVVDDSAGMRQLLASVLQSLGVGTVVVADGGPEAMALSKTHQIDLYIVDWEMQPMDGLMLIREIRRVSNFASALTPIVVLTAHSHPHVVRAALTNGANQFLTKPVVPQTLLNRMLWALNDRRPMVEQNGHFVHAAVRAASAPQPKSALSIPVAAAVSVPKPAEMWEVE
ncbi:MAG TPA: hypothetical protein DCL54_01270 [Alphaproteobacteria bacterium]|nr:hypothetical protein [Alphaproteobacteria bacterium]HAJ45196.1 hypothetical protein [Alphaproteobacteria bacterium]